MDDLSTLTELKVINDFTETFSRFIDSGFGLLGQDVAYLITVLLTIEITLSFLSRIFSSDDIIPSLFFYKILYIGFFALVLNNYQTIAGTVLKSFAALGLKAASSSITLEQLFKPGFIATTGFTSVIPLYNQMQVLTRGWGALTNCVLIFILLIAMLTVIIAFFYLAVQLFAAIIEFKLTTLIGFVLLPFALFGKTTFIADRVFTNILNSGFKMMLLGLVIGIGNSYFKTYIAANVGADGVTFGQSASLVLGAMCVLMLASTIPALAQTLITGSPNLTMGHVAQSAGQTRTIATHVLKAPVTAGAYLYGKAQGSRGSGETGRSSASSDFSGTGSPHVSQSSMGRRSAQSGKQTPGKSGPQKPPAK